MPDIKVIKTFIRFDKGLDSTQLKSIKKELDKFSLLSISEVDHILDHLKEGLSDYEMKIGEILKEQFNLKGSNSDIINTYIRDYDLRLGVTSLLIKNIINLKEEILSEFRDLFESNDEKLNELSDNEIIHVIIDWFLEKNKLYGMFNMDVRAMVKGQISITDTSPRDQIYTKVQNYYNIKKAIENPSCEFRYQT